MLLELWALGTGREGEKGVTCGGWLDLQGREEASEREKNKARLLFRTTSTSFEVVSTGRLLSSSASPCGNLPTSSPRAGQEPAACRHQNRGPAPHRALVPLLARGCGRSTREQGSSGRTSTPPRSTSPLLLARPLLPSSSLDLFLSFLRRRRHCCRCLLLLPASAALPRPEKSARRFWLASRGDASPCLFSSLPLSNTFFASPFKKKKKKKTKQIAALRPSLKAELKNELTEELSASGALVADAGPEPGPIRWIAEAFSFYRGQTVLLEETLRDTIGGAKAALLEGTLDEGPEWDIGYTSKKRCTDIEGQTKAGQRSCCIPRLQTLTWKDSLAEALVKQFGPQRAFNVTPPSFLIPEQLAEWRHWAKNNEPPGTAWVLKELRHGKVGVTILPFEEATVAAEERGDPDDDDDEEDGGEPGHRYRVAQRYLKDTMLSSALGGNFWKFFILRGQGGGGESVFFLREQGRGRAFFFS